MRLQTISVLALGLSLGACATATRGTHEMVNISSQPLGATAISDIPSKGKETAINGYLGCQPTPCGINLPRKSHPVITISKAGYQNIKFKIVSSNATSSTSVPTGAIVAGTHKGSHVIAGSPDMLKRIPVGGAIIAGSLVSFGGGALLDAATGAGRSLSPNPVTVYLAPLSAQNRSSQSGMTP